MKSAAGLALVGLLAGAAAAEASPGYVHWEITKRAVPPTQLRKRVARRALAVDAPQDLKNFLGDYFVNVTVGNPPQVMSLLLDTGSSDTVLIDSSNAGCQQLGVCGFGTCMSL